MDKEKIEKKRDVFFIEETGGNASFHVKYLIMELRDM
jgi:hypothetical protein